MAEKLLGSSPTLIFSKEKKAFKMACNKPLELHEFGYELFPVPVAFAKLWNDFWKDLGVLIRLSL